MTMTNSLVSNREPEFHGRLLAAVKEVGQHTRIGLTTIQDDIQNIGGLQAAKKRLTTRHKLYNLSMRPSHYFLATRRIGRMDLSIEAIAVDPKWSRLFTLEEIDQAMVTLREYGFDPTPEALTGASTDVQVAFESDPPLAPIRLSESPRGLFWDSVGFRMRKSSECQVTAESAIALRNGDRPPAHPEVRKHISECPKCRSLYSDLVTAFERFDEVALSQWQVLLKNFQATMELGDEQLERFMLTGPADYEDREGYEIDRDTQLDWGIRPMCVWRATRLGCQVGRFMSAFAATFAERGDLWTKWRKGEIQGSVALSVRTIGREQFLLALVARNLLVVRSWPAEDEGVLWMPADEGLTSVTGVVQVESSRDLEEWEELLGNPPEDLNLQGILYLTYCAAVEQLRALEPSSSELVRGRESPEQLHPMKGTLRAIQNSQAELLEGKAQDRQWQDAVGALLERMALKMESTDRYSCEE
jgi:hypothetical protein